MAPMGPIKCPKMVVGATAKDVDMPESKADGEEKPARMLPRGEGGAGPHLLPHAARVLLPVTSYPQLSGGRHEYQWTWTWGLGRRLKAENISPRNMPRSTEHKPCARHIATM